MRLVINGDDLGYTMGNTNGIFQAYRDGILRSTTALTNSKYIVEAAKMCEDYPGLGVGVHMTLTLGRPLTENKTLHDENGEFYPGRKMIWTKNPDYNEIYLPAKRTPSIGAVGYHRMGDDEFTPDGMTPKVFLPCIFSPIF